MPRLTPLAKCTQHLLGEPKDKHHSACGAWVWKAPVLVFWLRCKSCVHCIALHVLHRTAWRPHVGLCDKLGWISRSEVRCNIIMSNCIMSNYVTLWRQRTVRQFSWCPQRDMSPLWPVIKLQGDSTSDRQMVTLDGGGRGPAWPVITLSLRTFVIGLDHFWNSRKTVTYPPENCGFGSTLKLAVFGFDLKTITALIVSMSTRCILIKWRVVFCRTNTAERWQHHTHPAGWWRCNWIVDCTLPVVNYCDDVFYVVDRGGPCLFSLKWFATSLLGVPNTTTVFILHM